MSFPPSIPAVDEVERNRNNPPADARPPPVPHIARQQNAAAAQKIAGLELRLKYAEDRVGLAYNRIHHRVYRARAEVDLPPSLRTGGGQKMVEET